MTFEFFKKANAQYFDVTVKHVIRLKITLYNYILKRPNIFNEFTILTPKDFLKLI